MPMLLVANVPAKLLLNRLTSPGPVLLLFGDGGSLFFRVGSFLAALHPPLHQRQRLSRRHIE